MPMQTILLSFEYTDQFDLMFTKVREILQRYFPTLTQEQRVSLNSQSFLVVYSSPTIDDLTFTVRNYSSRKLISIVGEIFNNYLEYKRLHIIEDHLKKDLDAAFNLKRENQKEVEAVPLIKRNNPVPLFFQTSDCRILEYDFDEILINEDSPFQNIKILSSPTLGNALLLDDLQNLAEADINYTHGLMNFGKNSYKDKEILILGGGDGALLHELLKESPKFVTMIDIDEKVMLYCRKYLRKACGDTLDTFDGVNYKVIVADCLKYMQEYIEQKRIFDVVFNDLTDIPISNRDDEILWENQEELWKFVKKILTMSMQLLRSGGLYLNHAIGVGSVKSLEDYETVLRDLPEKVEFSRHTAYVPSFLEEWVFYQVTKN